MFECVAKAMPSNAEEYPRQQRRKSIPFPHNTWKFPDSVIKRQMKPIHLMYCNMY